MNKLVYYILTLIFILSAASPSCSMTTSPRDTIWTKMFNRHCESILVLDSTGSSVLIGSRNMLYKTVDAGRTWEILAKIPGSVYITQIVKLEDDTCTILVNTHGTANGHKITGIYKSSDQGRSFLKVLDNTGEGLPIVKIKNSNRLFCSGYRPPSLYTSIDDGLTWKLLGAFSDTLQLRRMFVCSMTHIELDNKTRFLFGTCVPARVLITDDTGKTWKFTLNVPDIELGNLPQFLKGQKENEIFACSTVEIYGISSVNFLNLLIMAIRGSRF